MAISYSNTAVKDIIYATQISGTLYTYQVAKVISGAVIYYERPGRYEVGTIPTTLNIAGITTERLTTLEPSVTATTATITPIVPIYHEDELNLTPTAATYWTATPTVATVDFRHTNVFSAAEYLEPATKASRTVSIQWPAAATDYFDTAYLHYYFSVSQDQSTSLASSTVVPDSLITLTDDAWQGDRVDWTIHARPYYYDYQGTSGPATHDVTITPTIQPKMRTITVNGDIIQYAQLSWYASPITPTSQWIYGTTTFNAWSGHSISWSGARANTYWTISNPSGFIAEADTDAPCTVTFAASRLKRDVNIEFNHTFDDARIAYTNVLNDGDTDRVATNSTSGTFAFTKGNVWSGSSIVLTLYGRDYYNDTTFNYGPSESTITFNVSANRKTRDVTASLSHINNATFSYTDSSGAPVSKTVNNSDITSIWCGATAYLSGGTADTYYHLPSTGVSLVPTNSAAATYLTYNALLSEGVVKITWPTQGIASLDLTYLDLSGNTQTLSGITPVPNTTTTVDISAWQGGTLSWAASGETYFDSTTGSLGPSTNTRICVPEFAYAGRTINVTKHPAFSSIVLTYTNTSGTSISTTVMSSSQSVSSVWQGSNVSWAATGVEHWNNASGFVWASTAQVASVNPTPTRYERPVSVSIGTNSHISSVAITYVDVNQSDETTTTTATRTTSGTFSNIWSGRNMTIVANPNTYYYVNPVSWTVASSMDPYTFTPSAAALMRTVDVVLKNVTWAVVNYNTSDSSTTSYPITSSAVINAWCGANVTVSGGTPATWCTISSTSATLAPANSGSRATVTLAATKIARSFKFYTTERFRRVRDGGSTSSAGLQVSGQFSNISDESIIWTFHTQTYAAITHGLWKGSPVTISIAAGDTGALAYCNGTALTEQSPYIFNAGDADIDAEIDARAYITDRAIYVSVYPTIADVSKSQQGASTFRYSISNFTATSDYMDNNIYYCIDFKNVNQTISISTGATQLLKDASFNNATVTSSTNINVYYVYLRWGSSSSSMTNSILLCRN